jgi:hypothetical protein
MGTIIEREPTPIPKTVSIHYLRVVLKVLTSNESTAQNSVVSISSNSSALNNDTNDEDGDINQDGVLSGQDLSKESRVHGTEPGTEFENRYEPALLGRVPFESVRV